MSPTHSLSPLWRIVPFLPFAPLTPEEAGFGAGREAPARWENTLEKSSYISPPGFFSVEKFRGDGDYITETCLPFEYTEVKQQDGSHGQNYKDLSDLQRFHHCARCRKAVWGHPQKSIC